MALIYPCGTNLKFLTEKKLYRYFKVVALSTRNSHYFILILKLGSHGGYKMNESTAYQLVSSDQYHVLTNDSGNGGGAHR